MERSAAPAPYSHPSSPVRYSKKWTGSRPEYVSPGEAPGMRSSALASRATASRPKAAAGRSACSMSRSAEEWWGWTRAAGRADEWQHRRSPRTTPHAGCPGRAAPRPRLSGSDTSDEEVGKQAELQQAAGPLRDQGGAGEGAGGAHERVGPEDRVHHQAPGPAGQGEGAVGAACKGAAQDLWWSEQAPSRRKAPTSGRMAGAAPEERSTPGM